MAGRHHDGSWSSLLMAFVVAGVVVPSPALPFTVRRFEAAGSSECRTAAPSSISSSDGAAPMAMLQTRFQTSSTGTGSTSSSLRAAVDEPFRFGSSSEASHPPTIGKWGDHPKVQLYEVTSSRLSGLVLNIFTKVSNGDGGLLLALEVPSPCGSGYVEVDRSRCSSKYPCALRLPALVVGNPSYSNVTAFRTRVIMEDEDYLTDFLQYDRVTLDFDAEATIAHESFGDAVQRADSQTPATRNFRFSISPAIAAGALAVMPVLQGATAQTTVTMRLRQPEPRGPVERASFSQQSHRVGTTTGEQAEAMAALEASLQSYRPEWAGEWRSTSDPVQGCGHKYFEVVADQLYPGEVEMEVTLSHGDSTADVSLTDVLVTSRLSWAEAEVSLLDTLLKDHFAFFQDPEAIIHGLPLDALKVSNPKLLTNSNPCEWGYAMEAWVIMAETGALDPRVAAANLTNTFTTLEKLQLDPEQYAHGLFYPYYQLRDKVSGEKIFPTKTDLKDLPCGDDALLYASLMLVQGWLKNRRFHEEADFCGRIMSRMDFSKCVRKTDCNVAGNGIDGDADGGGDTFWSVPLTYDADTLKPNSFNWNVWADEGGLVAMIVGLTKGINDEQYRSIVRQQQRYSPCVHWEGVTMRNAAFFNSIFTLPTRSMIGFGTLFASPYYHEFAVRSVLPAFRGFQKLKRKLGVDYIGPSDAMSMMPRKHPGKFFGSYAYFPPNVLYDCRRGKVTAENQCTWCKGVQYEGLDDPFDMIVPHGSMAAFLVTAMMERTQFSAWMEDTKKLITDLSEIYKPGYGIEVLGPARRTPRGANFDGAYDGRGIWEALSQGYTLLTMYEGLANMRRRYEIVTAAGAHVPGSFKPPSYRPLSDFLDELPQVRPRVNELLNVAHQEENFERRCEPSAFGPAGSDWAASGVEPM